ncbi:MAG: hypothetical protein AAF657_26915 [Acidobacteriota bacterium]
MSPSLYKVLHILGVLLSFAAIGGLTLQALLGKDEKNAARKLAGMTHGVALLLILITGFGMLAKLGLGFPTWVWIKVVIWLLIGASIAFIRRLPHLATVFWFGLPVLGAFAAYLAIYKPAF